MHGFLWGVCSESLGCSHLATRLLGISAREEKGLMIDSNLYVRPELCKDQVRHQLDVLHTIPFPTFYFRLIRYTHHYADEPTFMESWTISEARSKYGNGGYKDKRLFVCIHLHHFHTVGSYMKIKRGSANFQLVGVITKNGFIIIGSGMTETGNVYFLLLFITSLHAQVNSHLYFLGYAI